VSLQSWAHRRKVDSAIHPFLRHRTAIGRRPVYMDRSL
jgi:hypothetical protein